MKGDPEFHELVCACGWCARCGSTSLLECAHIYPKGKFPELRHDERNALCLCRGCHAWGHSHGEEWREWLRVHHPDRLEYLQQHAGVGLKD